MSNQSMADLLQKLLERLDDLHTKVIDLPVTQDPASVMRCGALMSSERELVKEALEDAMRYRLFQKIVYVDRDDSFDAYDDEGMDDELTDRLVEWHRARPV